MTAIPSITNAVSVAGYISAARPLLQDEKDSPYRYSDASLVRALNLAITDARKIRPDLFPGGTFNTFDGTTNSADMVVLDSMYTNALLFLMLGYAQIRDDEEVQDQRAAAFLAMGQAKLTTVS